MQYLFCFVQNVASWLRMYCSVIDVVLSGVSSTLTFLASSRQDLGHFVFWEDFFLGASPHLVRGMRAGGRTSLLRFAPS